MALMTRCLHCQTVFRVTPEQLRAHGGRVRCGRCLRIFNGLDTLVPEVQTTPAPAADAPVPAAVAQPDIASSAAAGEPAEAENVMEAVVGSGDSAVSEMPAHAGDVHVDVLPEPPVAAEATPALWPTVNEVVAKADAGPDASAAADAQVGTPDDSPREASAGNPFMHEDKAAPTTGRRQPWLIAACVLLVIGLGAQAIYFYRGDIAARHPLARQWLDAACERMSCAVPLPQLPKSVLIEASDLQLLDPARPERIQLTATLRNHAGHAVAYPALDLVLTNANDHTLARRIFLPAEYLGSGRDAQAGLAANAELTVRLALDIGNLGAAGFRLAVLAAPR